MSQRNRSGRGSNRANGTAHGEEMQLWDSAKEKFQELVAAINKDNANLEQIIHHDKQAAAAVKTNARISAATLSSLDELTRKGVKNADQISSNIGRLVEQLTILKGVQLAKETAAEAAAGPPPGSRTSMNSRAREPKPDTSLYDFDADGDGAIPSPVSSSARKLGDRGSNRDSMPPKAESVEPQGPSSGGSGSAAGGPAVSASAAAAAAAAAAANALSRTKVVFNKGQEVAFKPKLNGEATSDWILGEVAQVLGEGKSRRYKVLDVDPDENVAQKEYRSSASSMISITPKSQAPSLPQWDVGKTVLALYPNTTTFYKAEVMGTAADGRVNLRFDGENDSTTMQQVERRFVIEYRA